MNQSSRFWSVLLLSIVTLPFFGGCATDQKVIGQADTFNSGIQPAEERSPEVNDYLTRLGRRIQAAAQQADHDNWGCKTHFDKKQEEAWMFTPKVEFHLVNSKTLNAFTTGGYHVYVYNELLQQCRSEDELAAVMAHEFGHIYCRHVHKGMNRSMAMLGLAGAAGAGGYLYGGSANGAQYAQTAAGLAAQVGQFANMGFTRGDEAQADEDGFQFYFRGGWDPRRFGAFFQRMIDLGYDKTPAELSDHPTLASRVEAARKRVAALGNRIDQNRQAPFLTPDQFQHVKQVAQQVALSTPDDTKLAQTKLMLQAMPRSCWAPTDPPDRQSALQKLLDELKARQEAEQKAAPKTGQ